MGSRTQNPVLTHRHMSPVLQALRPLALTQPAHLLLPCSCMPSVRPSFSHLPTQGAGATPLWPPL